MEIYIVWRSDYKNYGILGVTEDLDSARILVERYRDFMYKPVIEKRNMVSKEDIPEKMYYSVDGNKYGFIFDKPRVSLVGSTEKELYDNCYDLQDVLKVKEYGKNHNELSVLVQADSAESAEKIAVELFTMYLEENE